MDNVRKYLPIAAGIIVAVAIFFISRKIRKGNGNTEGRDQILEKAREAKLAKSILKKSEDEESTSNS
jgi:hypothetical protein